MAKFTFKGGIHPFDGKKLSKDLPIETINPGKLLYYPLAQHIGAPAKAIVAKGDAVLAGGLIAEAGGFVSANIYSSVSGTVKGIERHRVVSGDMVDCIVIENDEKYTEAEPINNKKLEDMSRQEIIDTVAKAGIIGMGGAGFPTHVKLSPKEPEKIDSVIINCAECEPYLTSDYRKMLEEPEKLVDGLKIILSLFEGAIGYLAIEDNKPDCIKLLKEKVASEDRIKVVPLMTKYPQGSERHLIYAVTKRKLNSKMLPADAGCIVNNVDTVIAIHNAVRNGRPLYERIVTVSGDAVTKPCNYKVRTGMLYSEIIEYNGGFKQEPAKIISGGPMMGMALFDLDVPCTKASSALLCLTKDEVSMYEPSACINCGKCVEVCPGRVVPKLLSDLAEQHDEEGFIAHNGMECCECGCCSYICPAKRNLTQNIKSMRKIALSHRKKK